MSGFSNDVENALLDFVTGGSAPSYPDPTYLALTVAAVADSDDGTTIIEPSYTGYARLAVAASDWNAAAGGSKSNLTELVFPDCTAGSSTIVGWALLDADTAGNVIISGSCASTLISTTQTPPTVAPGALSLALD